MKKSDHDWKNCRQNYFSYYQPQPAVQNHRQQYRNDRRMEQASHKNNYDGDKGVSHGMICSGIPTPEKQATPIIPLKRILILRKETNRFIFNFIRERNQRYGKLGSFTEF